MKRLTLIAGVLMTFIVTASAYAKGPVDMVTLVGPHWYGEVEISDPDLLAYLSLGVFADLEHELVQPVLVSTGYLMARFFEHNGEYQRLDNLMYFPGARPGDGVVYYIEMSDANGPYDGKWFRVYPESEAALLNWLSEERMIPTSIEFESPGINDPGPDRALLVGGGTLLVGLLGGMAIGRRKL